MPRRNQYETEYKANFKPYKVQLNQVPQFFPLQRDQAESSKRDDGDSQAHDNSPAKKSKQEGRQGHVKRLAKENRALQYKAGIPPSMARTKKRHFTSEYQKQFQWKKPVGIEAPILSAEKIVFKSDENLPPAKLGKINMPTKSEYQLQFVKYPMVSPNKDEKIRRRVKDQISADLSWEQKPSSPSPEVPHPPMIFQSEYLANFQPPASYEYTKGAWVGADPPHLYPPQKGDDGTHPQSPSWYQQVTELRNIVSSYRARARSGTQFMGILTSLEEQQSITLERANQRRGDTPRDDGTNQASDNQTRDPKSPGTEHGRASKGNNARRGESAKQRRSEGSKKPQVPDNQPGALRRHPVESLSHVSTKGSSIDREDIDSSSVPRKREAWAEPGPIYPKVVPPYGVSGSPRSNCSSVSSDADVTLTDELMGEEPDKPRVNNKTRILKQRMPTEHGLTQRRQDDRTTHHSGPQAGVSTRDITPEKASHRVPALSKEPSPQPLDSRTKVLHRHEGRNRESTPENDSPRHHTLQDEPPSAPQLDSKTKKLFMGRDNKINQRKELSPVREITSDFSESSCSEEPSQGRAYDKTRNIFTGTNSSTVSSTSSLDFNKKPHQGIDSKTRKLYTGRVPGTSSTTSDSYSSGDEASSSLSSSVLSSESMQIHKDLAKETLQRAKNRKVKF